MTNYKILNTETEQFVEGSFDNQKDAKETLPNIYTLHHGNTPHVLLLMEMNEGGFWEYVSHYEGLDGDNSLKRFSLVCKDTGLFVQGLFYTAKEAHEPLFNQFAKLLKRKPENYKVVLIPSEVVMFETGE